MSKTSHIVPPVDPANSLAEIEERTTYAVWTFANCQHKEEQVASIQSRFKIQRRQALKYWTRGKERVAEAFTKYEQSAAEDAFNFLMSIRSNPLAKTTDRIMAQRELRETFQFGKTKKLEIIQDTSAPMFAANINVAILADPEALQALEKLDARLANTILHTSDSRQNLQPNLAISATPPIDQPPPLANSSPSPAQDNL